VRPRQGAAAALAMAAAGFRVWVATRARKRTGLIPCQTLVERCVPMGASVTCLYRRREQLPYVANMVCMCTCQSTALYPYTYRYIF
jgi:hypothetical protein